MRRRPQKAIERCRIKSGQMRSRTADGCNGAFCLEEMTIIASDGAGWDHVSVSLQHRCPTWEEMETVRGWFFEDHETVIQFSPPRDANRVNFHPYCLHMWRNQKESVSMPPSILVGPTKENADD